MPKTTILEAIEKIRRSIREGESDARGVLESVRELWDELDLGLYDRRTLAIVGLVDLVGRALEKKSPSPEELEDLVKEGPREEAPREERHVVLAGEGARPPPGRAASRRSIHYLSRANERRCN
jgi:hypothetical protein